MKENILNLLREYGLDEKESKIYEYLVIRGKLTAYKISKDTKILRSNSYNVLARLVEKGFVAESIKKNKKLYYANDLNAVIGKIKNKEAILETLIPQIKILKIEKETEINHLNTKNSFAQFNNKLFNLADQGKLSFCYMISNSPSLTTRSSKIFIERLLKKLNKNNSLSKIDARAIWDVKFKNNNFINQFKKLGKNRFLEELPNQATMFVYDGSVAFTYFEENDSFIEIKSDKIAKEIKCYFEYLWTIAKK